MLCLAPFCAIGHPQALNRRVVGFLEVLNAVSLKEGDLKKTARKKESDNKKRLANMSNEDGVEWLNVNTPGDWPHEK